MIVIRVQAAFGNGKSEGVNGVGKVYRTPIERMGEIYDNFALWRMTSAMMMMQCSQLIRVIMGIGVG